MMRDHPPENWLRRILVASCALVVCFASAGPAEGAGGKYVRQTLIIKGASLHNIRIGDENATAVVGQFSLTVGKRTLSGDRAVIWTTEQADTGGTKRDVTVYIEGHAKASSGDAASLGGKAMLVTLRHQGRELAEGKLAAGPPADAGLYARALAARQDEARKPVEEPTPRPAPRLVGVPGPVGADGATAKPAAEPPAVDKTDKTDNAAKTDKAAKTGKAADPTIDAQPAVMFYAEKFSTELLDPKDPFSQRRTIASGKVYLAQGDPDSRLFLELRCESAVLYTVVQKKKATSDKAPAKTGGGAALAGGLSVGGDSATEEVLVSVYLEGDVVIARGERTMRGPRAFYNFKTQRAYVVDGVYRTVQEQRNVPIYVRFKTARTAKGSTEETKYNREMWFEDVRVTTSDFYSPTYHIGAKTVRLKDVTEYDATGVAMGPQVWNSELKETTFNVGGIPIMYWPFTTRSNTPDGHTALRKVQVGDQGSQLGTGVETQWQLFRLLGIPKPKGFKGLAELSYYDRGVLVGADVQYSRPRWSGYTRAAGMFDNTNRDDFGDQRQKDNVPNYRGRFLHRHKQIMGEGWLAQLEASWYSDKTFTEAFFPGEFYGGKEQETLLYVKKQTDNRALTALLQYRLNRFDTQTESAPDIGFHVLGQSLADDRLTLFSETHAGMKRWRPANDTVTATRKDSRLFPRFDVREEIDMPLHAGPINIVPYVLVRGTYWDDTAAGANEKNRAYGQVGARANTHIWRVYNDVDSRLFDVHRLKHIVTPEVAFFAGDTNGVAPRQLLPMDPDIEQHLMRQGGYSVGVRQRLETKRGRGENRKTVDWMRLDVSGGGFRDTSTLPADGRYLTSRPEYSFGRSFINADYLWNVSDSTTLLSDLNHDPRTGQVGKASVSLNVARDPRLAYFGGVRYIRPLDSSVAMAGASYQLSRKYAITFYEQYDLDFKGGDNLATQVTLTRRLPRWYVGLSLEFDQGGEGDDVGVYLLLWPEGAPEVKIGSGKRGYMQSSNLN